MSLTSDVRQAVRSLASTPMFSCTVVLTLALGVGVNAAIFSVVDGVLFKPLPYPAPDQLVAVAELPPTGVRNTVSPASYFHWTAATQSFTGLAARQSVSTTLLDGAYPRDVRAANVSANYFDVLGIRPAAGRTFSADDSGTGSPCRIVLSSALADSLLVNAQARIGHTVRTSDGMCEVIGVLPADSVFDRVAFQLYKLLPFSSSAPPRGHFLTVIGRLAPGATVSSASAEMRAVSAAFLATDPVKRQWSAVVDSLKDTMVRADSKRLVLVLFGAVTLVLLTAIVNISSLYLARASARRREVSVRLALGASAGRLFKYFVTESAVLAVAGGGLGLIVGAGALRALTAMAPPGSWPAEAVIALDLRVVAFCACLMVATTLAMGVIPAFQSLRASASDALRREGRGATVSRSVRRVQHALLIAQVAVAMMLVLGASWLAMSLLRLSAVDPGFDPANVLTFRLGVPGGATAEQSAAFHARVDEALRSLPGAERVGAATSLPLRGWLFGTTIRVAGESGVDPATQNAHVQFVVGDYFDALRITTREGRVLSRQDQTSQAPVVVVNETFVRRFLGGRPAVGRQVHLGGVDQGVAARQIVGVVNDLKTGSLADAELRTPEVYVPHAQGPSPTLSYVVRSTGAVSIDSVRDAVRRVDPSRPLTAVMPMTNVIGESMVTQRFRTVLVVVFALLALVVAVMGVYALRMQSVTARRREMGIRLALGATRQDVTRLVIAQGLVHVGLGMCAGIVAAWWASSAINQWLFAVGRSDLMPLLWSSLALAAAGLLASWIPARQLGRVDPAETLRSE